MKEKPAKPRPEEPVGRFNFHGGWSASDQIAFKHLQYASKEEFEFIVDHKEEIINTTFEDAVRKGIIPKMPSSFFGWMRIQAMARVLDAFIALADD